MTMQTAAIVAMTIIADAHIRIIWGMILFALRAVLKIKNAVAKKMKKFQKQQADVQKKSLKNEALSNYLFLRSGPSLT